MATIATEQGHWYARDGTPFYTVVGANGKERPTTLRDARKLDLVPSVTTIIRCAAAPSLERWKRNQVLLAALTLPRTEAETEAEWLVRVERDWQEQGKKAADLGTEIHGAIERYLTMRAEAGKYTGHVAAAISVIPRGNHWNAEKSFAHPLGYGGKCDLHSPEWVIDFKTKDGPLPDTLYDEHAMQLAAYRRGFGLEAAKCAIVFVGRDRAEAKMVPADEGALQRGMAMFDALLAYWIAQNRVTG